MLAHDLAKLLLDGPNIPVALSIACSEDTVTSHDGNGNLSDIEVHNEPANLFPVKEIELRAYVEDIRFAYSD